MKYHVIPKEQLFPEHLTDGTLKYTLLGKEYQIMIHLNSENKVYKVNYISIQLHCLWYKLKSRNTHTKKQISLSLLQTLINDVALDGNFTEIRHGVIISVSRVLVIHKNYCSKDMYTKTFVSLTVNQNS